MRSFRVLLCSAIERSCGHVTVAKDYKGEAEMQSRAAERARSDLEFAKYPLRYQILRCKPGMPLAITKMRYLLACRRTHPDAGGDAEAFLRVNLAYQDVMKDYGVETVNNVIVNLGNAQADASEARNYLDARSHITSYIPVATLDEHIARIEAVRTRLGDHLAQRLSANDDEAVWLLEDIEEMMEETGLKTVRLRVVENGKVTLLPQEQLTDGTERPLFLPDSGASGEATPSDTAPHTAMPSDAASSSLLLAETSCSNAGHGDATPTGVPRTSTSDDTHASGTADEPCRCTKDAVHDEAGGAHHDADATSAAHEVQVHSDDIDVLNAKHTLQERYDVASLAARTATEVMQNTTEVQQLRRSMVALIVTCLSLLMVVYVYLDGLARVRSQKKLRPEVAHHLQADTMLPWWGNDVEYERQVKRIFVEEWRSARASARRAQMRQEGIARESLDETLKKEMDLRVFTLTAAQLHTMRERAIASHTLAPRGSV